MSSVLLRLALSAVMLVAVASGGGCDGFQATVLGVDEISPEGLGAALGRGEDPLLVDTRDAASYQAGHIAGALSLRPQDIDGYFGRLPLLRHRRIVTICYHGQASLTVAAHIAGHGHPQVRSLAGGMDRWKALGKPVVTTPAPSVDPKLFAPLRLPTTWLQQLASVISGLVFKPIYMLLALLLIVVLWRQDAKELVLLRRALIGFDLGELACALNYLIFGHANDTMEILHGFGMAVFGTYLAWGLFEWLDQRVLRFSEPSAGCAFQRFCKHCWKREQVSCGLQRLFLLLAPALAMLALMPLTTSLRPQIVILPVFGSDVGLHKTMLRLVVELRVLPVLSALLYLLATLHLLGGKESLEKAKAPFFWAFGLSTFSLLRYLLFVAYRPMPIWADWWEEVTELLAISFVALLLYVFRAQWGLRWGKRGPEPATETETETNADAPS